MISIKIDKKLLLILIIIIIIIIIVVVVVVVLCSHEFFPSVLAGDLSLESG